MNLSVILQELANCTHHQFTEIVKSQPEKIQNAFAKNDADFIKKCMGESGIVAHRDLVIPY